MNNYYSTPFHEAVLLEQIAFPYFRVTKVAVQSIAHTHHCKVVYYAWAVYQ